MGNEEADTLSKTSKSSSAQEQPPPTSSSTVFPDWTSIQAYYNPAGSSPLPPGFYHSSVASSPGHPYMWAPQHMIPPYGTPPAPYVTMYPHGGLYPHPSMPPGTHPYSPYAMPSLNGAGEASVAVSGTDVDGKNNENGKGSGASANSGASQSGESGTEGSSEGSDAQSPEVSDQRQSHERGHEQNGNTSGAATRAPTTSTLLPHAPLASISPDAIAGPTTTLNIGMDYWGGSSSSSITPSRSKLPVKPATASLAASNLSSSRDGVPSDLWLQDEREIKRQKRKQSNRESARRSRLRKQAECEELAQRVGTLKEENDALTEELRRIREECEKLTSDNVVLTERIQKLKGKEPRVLEDSGQSDSKVEVAEKTKGDC